MKLRFCRNCIVLNILFFSLFLLFKPVMASATFEIDDVVAQYMFVGSDQEYLEDNGYSFHEVSAGLLKDRFLVNHHFATRNADLDKAYWVRIKIKGNPRSEKKWIIEFFDQTTDFIEAYIPDGKGGFIIKQSGDARPFDQRKYRHKNFAFDIPNNTSVPAYYYFKIKSAHNAVNVIIVLRSIDYFIYYALNEYFLYGLFYGTILIILVYNFMMYFAVKELQHIVYIFYLSSVGVYFMCLDGIAYQYLWPNHSDWNQIAYGVALFLVIIFSLLFTKLFLHTRAKYPLLNKLINITIAVRCFVFFVMLFFPRLFELRGIDVFPLSLTFFCGLYAFKKGYKPARFFVVAHGFLFIGFMMRILLNLNINIVPSNIFVHYSINMSFLCEMLLLTFALGDKVRIIRYTKDKVLKRLIRQGEINQQLKDKVNRELENEVLKRTQEILDQRAIIEDQNQALQRNNALLRQQAEEIQKMNAMLDKDNYRLKNDIKEKMVERAANKNMEYDEFKTIFPDELSCFRYLAEEKWGKGFHCKQCNGVKYIAGKGKFDRRCTRCGYNESPTAFTIFHGVKFSLVKAFYILHLVITERDDLTLDQISVALMLRKNTCRDFKRRVVDSIEKYNFNKEQLSHWQNVIFFERLVA